MRRDYSKDFERAIREGKCWSYRIVDGKLRRVPVKKRAERMDRTYKTVVRRYKRAESYGAQPAHPHSLHKSRGVLGKCGNMKCPLCKMARAQKKIDRKRDRIKRKKVEDDD